MKRKLLIILSLLVTAATFAGCGTSGTSGSSHDSESSSVTHEHAFSELQKDADGHWYKCECGEEQEKTAHSGGEATCTEKAECEVCGQEYGAFAEHSYTVLKYDADGHWYECECGEKQAKASHSGGEATCTEKAECEVCGQEYGATTAHSYIVLKQDANGHWNECACGAVESAPVAHTFDIPKSDDAQHWTECACGWSSTKEDHAFDNLKYDAENHWYDCECGKETSKEGHKGGEAACSGAAVCEVCNQAYGKVGEHIYNIPKKDDTYHWNECGCGAIDESSKVAHQYSEAKKDETNHWNECACGATKDVAAHEYTVANKDETNHWNECACGAIDENSKVAHEYSDAKKDETNHWNECACGAIDESSKVAHEYSEAKKDETNHWNECSCGATKGVTAHEYTELKHDVDGHWYECKCGAISEKVGHSGGEASCTEKAKCEVCGEEHGELKAHEYTILDTTDASVDKAACACGAIDENYAFNKVIETRQEVALYGEKVTLSLAGISDYTAVKKIYVVKTTGANVDGNWVTTSEEISLGADITALDVTNLEKALHGENEVIVVVEDVMGEHTVKVPVLFITDTISTDAEWRAAVQTSDATGATYGYYVLTTNISLVALANNAGNPVAMTVNTGGTVGFLGTVDGKGFDVRTEASWWTNGHFGALGTGAVLKNISFTQTNSLNYGWNRFILGKVAVGTTFENVTFNLKNQTAISGGETNSDNNPLAYDGFMNCTLKNVIVNLENSSITSLFGGCSKWFGLHNTTFENCQVKLDGKSTMMEIGHKKDSTTEEITVYTAAGWTVEGATVLEGITVTQEAAKLEVTLAHQDIILSGSTYALNLGEYADYTISSIKLGESDLGTNASALAIPDAIKTDLTKHGAATVIVNAKKGAVEAVITIPVTLVTKAISTMQDLNTTVACVDADIYGYYILTNNVSFSEEGFAAVTNAKRGWASTVAFRGTLDGRGYTVAANSSQWGNVGLFGTMNGATVKNITITDGWNNGSALIAYAAYNVTFTDVNIEIKNGKANAGTAGSMSIFANALGGNGSFTNVNIKTAIDMPVLLPGMTAWIKFSNVTVTGNVTNLSLTTGYESFDAVSGITVSAAA